MLLGIIWGDLKIKVMGGVWKKEIFLLGDPFNGFACFRTHLFAFGGPGGVDSAFSANCSLGLLWLRDSFPVWYHGMAGYTWETERKAWWGSRLSWYHGMAGYRRWSLVCLDSQQPGAAHTSQLPQKSHLILHFDLVGWWRLGWRTIVTNCIANYPDPIRGAYRPPKIPHVWLKFY